MTSPTPPETGGRVPETAMVMAAGLGQRMRPLTNNRPKPLVEVAGKPLIDHALDHLKAAGVRRAVVNVHYLPELIEAHLRGVDDLEIAISDERAQLLETGGGLVHARPLLGDAPVFVINSDNYWTNGREDALRRLAAAWDPAIMDVLLLLIPIAEAQCHAGRGDFQLGPDGRIIGRQAADGTAPFTYIGIQMLDPRIIADAPEGPFSTNLFWNRAIEAGRAYGQVHDGQWFDIGAPAAIPVVEGRLAHG